LTYFIMSNIDSILFLVTCLYTFRGILSKILFLNSFLALKKIYIINSKSVHEKYFVKFLIYKREYLLNIFI